jgi:hypothetical protein
MISRRHLQTLRQEQGGIGVDEQSEQTTAYPETGLEAWIWCASRTNSASICGPYYQGTLPLVTTGGAAFSSRLG